MDTRLGHLADIPARVGIPKAVANPIRPERFAGQRQAPLGLAAGLTQFGVNHLILEPGAWSSLRHWHEGEDEFVYVLDGELTLVDENGAHVLRAGSFAGFPAGVANAHHLENRSDAPAAFLAIGTRLVGRETIHYPDDPLPTQVVVRDARGNRIAS
jgi:uncharacterized cupin superfamily protein